MNKQVKKILIIVLGICFVILGILGLALPFLQGFLFLAIGIVLLSMASSKVRAWSELHTRRYPKIHHFVKKVEKVAARFIDPMD